MSKLRTVFHNYGGSMVFTVVALSCAFGIGHRAGGVPGGTAALFTALMLGAL